MIGMRCAVLICCAMALMVVMGAVRVATAQEFVVSDGALADGDFYRLIACAAPPGGACQKPFVRWVTARPLTVQLERVDRAFLGGKSKRADAALERALQRIAATGVGIELRRVTGAVGKPADIRILLLDTPSGELLAGTGVPGLDGQRWGGASTRIWFEAGKKPGEEARIARAAIVFSRSLSIRSYESAMLEELTQALGLMTDIRNPWYEPRSIFSQDSNAMKDLGAQDTMVVQRHYPPK